MSLGMDLPGESAVKLSRLGVKMVADSGAATLTSRMQIDLKWSWFFFFALAVWGLFPRVLFWLTAWMGERRALAGLVFQEPRHRTLWRELSKVQRGEIHSSQADGVVLLDVGGLEVETETIRPFLLRELRVNPEARFYLGPLDEEGERKALQAARDAAMGVVFLVEGWNLSPKQMAIYHARVREAIGADHLIRYLVVGNEEEFKRKELGTDFTKEQLFRVSKILNGNETIATATLSNNE